MTIILSFFLYLYLLICYNRKYKLGSPTETDLRKYLSYELPKQEEGKFYYKNKGPVIDDEDQLFIIFYKGRGKGCGIAHKREKVKLGESKGYIQFYPETIFNISDITEEEMLWVSPKPNRIKRIYPYLDINSLPDILDLIYEKWRSYF